MKKEKNYKKENQILSFFAGVLVVIVVLLLREVLNKGKYDKIDQYLVENYYSIENLETAIRAELGDAVDEKDSTHDFVAANFDNYVINLLLDDINEGECERIAKYNKYLKKTDADKIMNIIEEDIPVSFADYGDIAYAKISCFSKNETYNDFVKNKDFFAGKKKIVIDLRDNSGGSTDELIKILSMFYPKGTNVFSNITSSGVNYEKTNKDPFIEFDKIVFICNEKTASSSEVLIFNMKSDFPDKINVVGTKTYGKNFSYSYRQFKDGEMVMFVSGYMGNSKGETFDEDGIIPDYVVDGTEALEMALELLK